MNFRLSISLSQICLTIIQTSVVAIGWSLFSAPAQAQNCPYDSYMIINGRCVNIPSQKKPARPVESQPSYYDSGNGYTNNPQNLSTYNPNAKTCSDFTYQDEAQDYALKNPDEFLDGDSDAIACEHLPWRKYGYLDKSSYTTLKNEYYRRKQSQTFGFRDKITMSIDEVESIMGFPGHYIGNSTWIWGNIYNPKQQIKVKVQANQIRAISKKGF